MRDVEGFERVDTIVERVLDGLRADRTGRWNSPVSALKADPRPASQTSEPAVLKLGGSPIGAGDMGTRSLDRRSIAAGRDAAILQWKGATGIAVAQVCAFDASNARVCSAVVDLASHHPGGLDNGLAARKGPAPLAMVATIEAL